MRNIKNNKGAISIMGVIMSLVLVTSITYYLRILSSSFIINEVQSMMDLAATNTLQNSIDSEILRYEIIGVGSGGSSDSDTQIGNNGEKASSVNQSKIRSILESSYRKELSNILAGGTSIKSASLMHFKSDLIYSSWGSNYEGVAIQRPQLRIEALTKLVVGVSSTTIPSDFTRRINMTSIIDGQTTTLTATDRQSRGEVELLVRSVTRLLYK
ncbi:MAG: hypothetical protein R3Y64_10165 [Peptostreptococcaceae bacterium]